MKYLIWIVIGYVVYRYLSHRNKSIHQNYDQKREDRRIERSEKTEYTDYEEID